MTSIFRVTVPGSSHCTVAVDGLANLQTPSAAQYALIEHPASPLPGGLYIQSCLISLPCHGPYKVQVIVRNESEQDVLIPPLTVIASIGEPASILSQHVDTTPVVQEHSTLQFNFADSPLSSEWKERITSKLNKTPEVFSQHDLDFGCTDKVQHQINLHDETPCKQRA